MYLNLTFLVKFCQLQRSQHVVAPMQCACALKITVRCRKYPFNILYCEPDPARTPSVPTASWDSHFAKLSMESYDSCKFWKKGLLVWAPLRTFCRTWLQWSDLTPLVWWIRASTSLKRGALAQCRHQRSEIYLVRTGWEQRASTVMWLQSTGQCIASAVQNSTFSRAFGFVQGLSKLSTLK